MVLLRKDVYKHFKCPSCMNFLYTPIIQCARGHSICSDCTKKLNMCPKCNGKFTATRNYALESLLSVCDVVCEKCAEVVQLGTNEHKHKCCWEVISCWLCRWKGERIGIQTHIRKHHKECVMKSGDEFKIHRGSTMVMLHKQQLIWIKQHSTEDMLFWSAYLIFHCKAEEKYSLALEILSDNEVYKFKQQCKSNSEEVVADQVVAVISKNLVKNAMKSVFIKVIEG